MKLTPDAGGGEGIGPFRSFQTLCNTGDSSATPSNPAVTSSQHTIRTNRGFVRSDIEQSSSMLAPGVINNTGTAVRYQILLNVPYTVERRNRTIDIIALAANAMTAAIRLFGPASDYERASYDLKDSRVYEFGSRAGLVPCPR